MLVMTDEDCRTAQDHRYLRISHKTSYLGTTVSERIPSLILTDLVEIGILVIQIKPL